MIRIEEKLTILKKFSKNVQSEIESYKDPEDEDNKDTIQFKDILILERI